MSLMCEVERDWIGELRVRDGAAIRDLHALLLRAARFELRRRGVDPGVAEDLAAQAADDAMMAVLGKLETFRGASRFTTWAYKFALLEAGVRARRRSWEGREVPLEEHAWASAAPSAHDRVVAADELETLRHAVHERLTPHQRTVFVALALNGVPIDVLSERLGTSRGALYKTLHDARKRLRAELAAAGYPGGGR